MIIQKLDLSLLKHVFGCLTLKFPLTPIKSGCLFATKENPLYRKRSDYSSHFLPRVFVYGSTTSMRISGSKSSCDGKGGFFTAKRIADARLCTESVYMGNNTL